MEKILKDLPDIEAELLEAVDGRILPQTEKEKVYDTLRFEKEHGRNARPGEIGCTLSHQKCYRKLLTSSAQSVIIFEDDIIVNRDLEGLINKVEEWLDTDEPRILLLSGWFWHSRPEHFFEKYRIAEMVDGLLTHAYALNRAAAELMIDEKPWYLADAWEMFRKRGIRIAGLKPHPFDQDWSGVFSTTVNDTPLDGGLKKLSTTWFTSKCKGLRNRLLQAIGRFEHPQAVATIKI